MDAGEGINIAVIKEEKPKKKEKEKKKLDLRFSVFFDGTLNNEKNIEIRLVSELNTPDSKLTDEEELAAIELIASEKYTGDDIKRAKEIYEKQRGKDNSYLGYFTNIVKMEKHVNTKDTEKYKQLKSYIEGPGTRDEKDDDFQGYALGKGKKSGVKLKVNDGIEDILSQIKHKVDKNKYIINTLTIDVFGFSRGAAGARYFIYVVLYGDEDYKSIYERLNSNKYDINEVDICFAGLYDTVSSYGFSLFGDSYKNNTEDLKLRSIRNAKYVVQLAAADEHRENFSLTNIDSAFNNGTQIFLPGAHSDIGGGYRDAGKENQVVFKSLNLEKVEEQERYLVDSGWYIKNKLFINKYFVGSAKHRIPRYYLKAERKGIENSYSKIPLQIMVKNARKYKVDINSALERIENVDSDSFLSTIKTKLFDYSDKIISDKKIKSNINDWENDGLMKELRIKYLHFSARYEIGHGPRIENGIRIRKQYEG